MKKNLSLIARLLVLSMSMSWFLTAYSQTVHSCNTVISESSPGEYHSDKKNLEAVLEHYRHDSQKYKAAVFLISNMAGCCSYNSPGVQQYYETMHSVFTGPPRSNDEFRTEYAKASSSIPLFPEQCDTVYDTETITSEYLIEDIDKAYEMWQKYSRHISFDNFCEYILPYRIGNEPLSEWRNTYYDRYINNISQYYSKQFNYYFVYSIYNRLNQGFNGDVYYPNTDLPEFSLKELLSMQLGNCGSYSSRSVAQLRAFGIPSTIDYIPAWGNRSMGHSWTVMFVNDSYTIPFGINEQIGSHFSDRAELVLPKVYRTTFSDQEWLNDISHDQTEYIPQEFRTNKYIDVTDLYVSTSDITIDLTLHNEIDVKWVYLSTFNNHSWVPVAFARRNGNKAYFPKVGRSTAYMVTAIDRNGKQYPVSVPFILDGEGHVRYMIPDRAHSHSIKVFRKYHESDVLHEYNHQLEGGRLVVSNDRDFKDSVIIDTVENIKENRFHTIKLNYQGKYKYFKYLCADYSHGNIAEIQLFDENGRLLTPIDRFGGACAWEEHSAEKVFDGNILTTYSRISPNEAWAAVELEQPTHISKVRIHPRSDGNSINSGDVYQLLIWDRGQWFLLGQQKAGYDDCLTFENVPDNALLLLHDATQGHEDRLFTYESGKQVWW